MLNNGEKAIIMGQSGCGKTTLLNIAAGLLFPDSGTFSHIGNKIAYMFQEPRLLPWCSVKENILAVLPNKKLNKDINLSEDKIADHYLESVELFGCDDLLPDKLSGGMKQRLAYARFLAFVNFYNADLLLLDEPFSSLDYETKNKMNKLLKSETENKTVIYVTHNISDAKDFCDRVITLE